LERLQRRRCGEDVPPPVAGDVTLHGPGEPLAMVTTAAVAATEVATAATGTTTAATGTTTAGTEAVTGAAASEPARESGCDTDL